jgi:tetraacyldisaccharide 4'-kinase
MADALPIIAKYKPDVILVDDGMQNPGFKKDLLIMTIDGSRGFGNGFPIPAGPMRWLAGDAIEDTDIIVINGKSQTKLELDITKKVFQADLFSDHHFGTHKYYAFAGIGNPEKFFSFLKKLGAKLGYTKIFPDHYKYSVTDVEDLVAEAKRKKLRLITTRKDYVKIQTPKPNSKMTLIPALQFIGAIKDSEKNEISQLEYLEVELQLENSEEFFELIFSKYDRYNLYQTQN